MVYIFLNPSMSSFLCQWENSLTVLGKYVTKVEENTLSPYLLSASEAET